MNQRIHQYANMTRQVHGGDRYRHQVSLDFSVNINPMGTPDYVKDALREAFASRADICCEWYPDPECRVLREALSSWHGVPAENILCGNGASELIGAFTRAAAVLSRTADAEKKRMEAAGSGGDGCGTPAALLPVPSFSEYERSLRAAGVEILYYQMKEKEDFQLTDDILRLLTPNMDMLLLCRPNNPIGNMIPDELLERILERCCRQGIMVLLDECFLELSIAEDHISGDKKRISDYLGHYSNLVILKAFTKLYAMPGLRLGYCMSGNGRLLAEMNRQLPCWNVSGIAQKAGVTALDNEKNIDYLSQSRKMIMEERRFLEESLKSFRKGIRILPGCANFICFYLEERGGRINLYEKLLDRGILIRDCACFPGMGQGWYRIAARPHVENTALIAAMKELLL